MQVDELLQYGVVGAGLLLFTGIIYAFIRFSKNLDAIFPETAKKYGLTHTKEDRNFFLACIDGEKNVNRLNGSIYGIPIEVASTYKTVGRTRIHSTVLISSARISMQQCTINIHKSPPAATVHLAPTGDAHFDANRWATCGTPSIVRSVLTPEVRAALLRCPQHEIVIFLDGERVVLSFPATPSNQVELHGPIDATLAIASRGAS